MSIYMPSSPDEPFRQGEILANVWQTQLVLETIGTDDLRAFPKIHPLALIVSQDCDLDWDYRARQQGAGKHKLIPNILLCEVTTAEQLRGQGTEAGINRKTWEQIRINKTERYQFLQAVNIEQDFHGKGLPELGVDFKRYFSVPADELYTLVTKGLTQRCCRLNSPYLEHFSTRFYYYQFRIALPEEHFSEPGDPG